MWLGRNSTLKSEMMRVRVEARYEQLSSLGENMIGVQEAKLREHEKQGHESESRAALKLRWED